MVVIGSGISGLSAGAILARKGMRVLVLEQHHAPGGLIQTFVRGRFRFDTGLHVLGELEPGGMPRRLLDALLAERSAFSHLGPLVDRLHTSSGPMDLLAGPEALVGGLERTFPGCGVQVRDYLHALERASRDAGLALLARNLPKGLGGVLDREAIHRGEELLASPAAPWVRAHIGDEDVAALLNIRAGYHATPLEQASAGAHAAVTHHYVHGAWAPEPDSRGITGGLCATIARAGGWTTVSADVRRILVEGGEAVGVVLTDGTNVRSPVVISAIGAPNTVSLLEEPPCDWASAIQALPLSMAHLGVYMGLSEDPQRFGATSASHWSLLEHEHMQGFYLRFPTVGRAGPHRATATALIDVQAMPTAGDPHERTAAYRQTKVELLEYLRVHVQRLFPGIGRSIEHIELSTPATTEHYARSPGGAIYGLGATTERFTCPSLRARTPVPGLLMAGTDIGMSGVIGGLMAGAYAAVTAHPRAFSVIARATLGAERT